MCEGLKVNRSRVSGFGNAFDCVMVVVVDK